MNSPSGGAGFRTELSPFASRTVTRHMARGVVGAILIAMVVGRAPNQPVLTLMAALGALVAFRGCPMCWSVGLVETVLRRHRDGIASRRSGPTLAAGQTLTSSACPEECHACGPNPRSA